MTRKPWAVSRAKSASVVPAKKSIQQYNSAWERKTWCVFSLTKEKIYREQLILHYIAFAETEAWSYVKTQASFLQYCDKLVIVSDAKIGLIEAIDAYMPKFGVNFEVFSRQRIRGSIIDGLRARDNFPRIVARQRSLLRPMFERLRQKLHREPTVDEFCRENGDIYMLTLSDPLFYSSVCHATSLKSEEDDGEVELTTSTAMARHGSSRTSADVQNKLELMELANFVLQEKRLRRIVTLYYFANKTCPQIATMLNISQSSVVMEKSRALRILTKNSDMFRQFLPEGHRNAIID
jgi:RNA polymerase sigma factor for flagellar operon FliA